jgi:hypothetical protein
LIDIQFGDNSLGWGLLGLIKGKRPDTIVCMMSGIHLSESDPLLRKADAYFEKPVDMKAIFKLLTLKCMLD